MIARKDSTSHVHLETNTLQGLMRPSDDEYCSLRPTIALGYSLTSIVVTRHQPQQRPQPPQAIGQPSFDRAAHRSQRQIEDHHTADAVRRPLGGIARNRSTIELQHGQAGHATYQRRPVSNDDPAGSVAAAARHREPHGSATYSELPLPVRAGFGQIRVVVAREPAFRNQDEREQEYRQTQDYNPPARGFHWFIPGAGSFLRTVFEKRSNPRTCLIAVDGWPQDGPAPGTSHAHLETDKLQGLMQP